MYLEGKPTPHTLSGKYTSHFLGKRSWIWRERHGRNRVKLSVSIHSWIVMLQLMFNADAFKYNISLYDVENHKKSSLLIIRYFFPNFALYWWKTQLNDKSDWQIPYFDKNPCMEDPSMADRLGWWAWLCDVTRHVYVTSRDLFWSRVFLCLRYISNKMNKKIA